MANSKLKCKQCKNYFSRDEILEPPKGFCSMNCVDQYYIAEQKKQHERFLKAAYGPKSGRKKGKTKKDCDSDLKSSKRAAIQACHKYIRERDKNKLCVCCDKPLGEEFHAGHFWESGNHPYIRFHEDNIHGQRIDCNYFKGGDSGGYRENLIKRIGIGRVKWLDENRSKPLKRTAEDYRQIEKYYKQKLKDLKKNRE